MKDLSHDTSHGELHAEMADRFDTTAMATETTLLNPRFYTTDFDEMDRIDVSPVRKDWDALLAQMKSDPNKGHFKKNADWDHVDWQGMDPALQQRLNTLSSEAAQPLFLVEQFGVVTKNMKGEPVLPFDDEAGYIQGP